MNRLLLILLLLLLILVILKISVIEEGFESNGLSQNAITEYNKFTKYYNWFMTNWRKAVIASAVSEIQQKPLDSPSQVRGDDAPKPSDGEMNLYIVALAKKIDEQLPPVGPLFPEKIDVNTITSITPKIPDDPKPYINALEWMNEQLEKSQKDLGSALQGGPIQRPVEKFQNQCEDLSQCMNNPEFLAKLSEAQKNNSQAQIQQYEQLMIARIAKFFSNQKLNSVTQKSIILLKKSEDIQNKAQSGQLINEINVPGGRSKIKYDTSGKKLSDFSEDERKTLQKDGKEWYAIKGLIDQINATL